MPFYNSPSATIPHPATNYTSIAMTRTSSNTSTTSTTSSSTYSTSPYMDIRPRTSSSISSNSSHSSHRSSISYNPNLLPSPYRSCINACVLDSPSSYLSEDDLLGLSDLELDSPSPSKRSSTSSTTMKQSVRNMDDLDLEQQIALLREQESKGARPQAWFNAEQQYVREKKSRVVRFAGEDRSRRSSGKSSRRRSELQK